ncbi:hypothetical protein MMC34_005902 [Xylographa carneopallida]|nr:hypothetical protein [Xylographa carneopallida]
MNNQQHGASTSATLRPRNRRLISIDDEFQTLEAVSSPPINPFDSTTSSFFSSRAASPLPSTHPSRSASKNRPPVNSQGGSKHLDNYGSRGHPSSPSAAAGFWGSSWTSIQEIASTLLGNDVNDSGKDKNLTSRSARRGKALVSKPNIKSSAILAEEWGPRIEVETHATSGSKEDRLAQVQAKKREALLSANGHTMPDSTGNYKRRLSEDRESFSAPPSAEHDREALVYLHHVQPSDTLAGVAIKYNCPVAVLRKANRLWANDAIQIRRTIYLPVDSCGVRGRKILEPVVVLDYLPDRSSSIEEYSPQKTPTTAQQNLDTLGDPQSSPLFSLATSPSTSNTIPSTDDPPWKHDSWVLIDSSPIAVEIARLPRRSLGFFPPTRRKSVTYSDADVPSFSFDVSRSAKATLLPTRHHSPHRNASPGRMNKSRSPSISYFASTLSGPGGVGTLGKEIRSPGPAQDKLNQLFAPHLPSVAPRTSFESVASTSSTGIENVGGAIEGWMRKMATKAAAVVQTPPLGGSGAGDLIELVEGWELDGGSGDADIIVERRDDRRGADGADDERVLSERFPARGRVFEDRGRKKGN